MKGQGNGLCIRKMCFANLHLKWTLLQAFQCWGNHPIFRMYSRGYLPERVQQVKLLFHFFQGKSNTFFAAPTSSHAPDPR